MTERDIQIRYVKREIEIELDYSKKVELFEKLYQLEQEGA